MPFFVREEVFSSRTTAAVASLHKHKGYH